MLTFIDRVFCIERGSSELYAGCKSGFQCDVRDTGVTIACMQHREKASQRGVSFL